ncbi:hypothetical protein [Flavobacterium branchiophilum]|uniref:Uncharacterized protein n=1 Tax=Flavobacterium branchiophilum TaxID=55197 RepID=A0A2H3KE68_9FLAO|nr:hypothetical protein [Flavobacterium branchiophilum]PDS26406.1 hypothetical protein B0A77_02515 [Flavobacterium branchiophilum]
MAVVKPDNFNADYILHNQSIFKMGAENSDLKMKGTTHLSMRQEVVKNKIYNTIITQSQKLETDNADLKPAIEELNYIANISKKINLTRNTSGKISNVDKKSLNDDWEFWKKNKMQNLIPEEYKQRKFIKKYDAGLHYFEHGLQNSLSHTLLLPQIYNALYQHNTYQKPTTATITQASKLIDALNIEYCFYPFFIKQEENLLIMCFETKISNQNQILEKIVPLYKQNKNFTIENFDFKIITKYFLDPTNYKIIYAELHLTEKMHNNLSYAVTINLSEKTYDVEPLKNRASKIIKEKKQSKETAENVTLESKKEEPKKPLFEAKLEKEKEAKEKTNESIALAIMLIIVFFVIILFLIYG